MSKVFEFDRRCNGRLMAQGAKITTAKNKEEALKIAVDYFERDGHLGCCTFKQRRPS